MVEHSICEQILCKEPRARITEEVLKQEARKIQAENQIIPVNLQVAMKVREHQIHHRHALRNLAQPQQDRHQMVPEVPNLVPRPLQAALAEVQIQAHQQQDRVADDN